MPSVEPAAVAAGPPDLRLRTRDFALRIIRLTQALPASREGDVFARQILRSGTSAGAQYREACRARSKVEFASKLQGSLQELDETSYWLELLQEAKLVSGQRLTLLRMECDELIAIFVASIRSAKRDG